MLLYFWQMPELWLQISSALRCRCSTHMLCCGWVSSTFHCFFVLLFSDIISNTIATCIIIIISFIIISGISISIYLALSLILLEGLSYASNKLTYCKYPQISCTFFPKIVARNRKCGLSVGTFEKGCFRFPVFHLRVQSNSWLLSCERSGHVLVVMQKSMGKTVLNEEIPVNKYQKKILIICQSW